jgi:hypothetical protein
MKKAFHLAIMLCLIMTACGPASTLTPGHPNLPTPEPTVRATNMTTTEPTLKPGSLPFQGKGILLMYPATWSSEVLVDAARFLSIESNLHDLNMNITRVDLGKFRDARTLEDVDKATWTASLRVYELAGHRDGVKLESHEAIEVGGQPATRRVFTAPFIEDPSQTVHKMLVLVVRGTDVYQIVANAASESALDMAEVTGIIASVQFAP